MWCCMGCEQFRRLCTMEWTKSLDVPKCRPCRRNERIANMQRLKRSDALRIYFLWGLSHRVINLQNTCIDHLLEVKRIKILGDSPTLLGWVGQPTSVFTEASRPADTRIWTHPEGCICPIGMCAESLLKRGFVPKAAIAWKQKAPVFTSRWNFSALYLQSDLEKTSLLKIAIRVSMGTLCSGFHQIYRHLYPR